jgi:hypothetical protein
VHTLSLNLLLALSIVLPLTTQATPRSDELMCEEVAFTVNESVTYGELTQEQADDISDRCYELYVN